MSLKHLSDHELLIRTERSLKVMRQAEVEVLRHFREIEERRLWTGAGSLYNFITRRFGLTADRIYPRLQAMRLMRAIPEVEHKLAAGELSVTIKPSEKMKAIATNQNRIQFYVDDETLKQIEELKAKFAHHMPSGKMEDLIKILIHQVHRPAKPRLRRITLKKRSRYIPVEVKRDMEKTRHLGCVHVDPRTGQRCGAKHFLQMDHLQPYSDGGPNETQNLQWLCGFHNRHRFETGRRAP